MSYKKFYNKIDSYYDTINKDMQEKISDLNNKNNYEYAFSQNGDIVEVYLNDLLIMKANYCIFGSYNIQLSVWYWSWNIAFINKKLIELPKEKIKEFEKTIENKYEKFNKMEAEVLHYLVSNDNFYISGNHIDKIIKLSLYLTNSLWYFPVKQDANKIQYILITKILQY
jgi:hypothetical protein